MDLQLKDIDPEDIEDVLIKVETSFNIRFMGDELINIKTLGELCDHIVHKIHLTNADDCTSQQAFYKLREAIAAATPLESKTITTDLLLTHVLPRQGRRAKTKQLKNHLGLKLQILQPPLWVTGTLTLTFLTSLVLVFFYWPVGLSGLLLSMAGAWIAKATGKELKFKTVGEVADTMTRENYLQSRRNPETFNKSEIEKILTDWFSKEFDIDKSKLTRDSKFV